MRRYKLRDTTVLVLAVCLGTNTADTRTFPRLVIPYRPCNGRKKPRVCARWSRYTRCIHEGSFGTVLWAAVIVRSEKTMQPVIMDR